MQEELGQGRESAEALGLQDAETSLIPEEEQEWKPHLHEQSEHESHAASSVIPGPQCQEC